MRERGEAGRYLTGSRRTAGILVRCTPEERERWREAAALEGLSLAAWVRAALESLSRARALTGRVAVLAPLLSSSAPR